MTMIHRARPGRVFGVVMAALLMAAVMVFAVAGIPLLPTLLYGP